MSSHTGQLNILQIHVSNRHQNEFFDDVVGPVEFGRKSSRSDVRRVVLNDRFCSGDQLAIRPLPGDRVSLQNLSSQVAVEIEVPERVTIAPGGTRVQTCPIRMTVGETTIELSADQSVSPGSGTLHTISRSIQIGVPIDEFDLSGVPDTETLIRWFETLVTVQRAAAGSDEFYLQTARAVVELIGLDRGFVLSYVDGDWSITAEYGSGQQSADFSRTVLREVIEKQRTFYEIGEEGRSSPSLSQIDAVVAAPIFDATGESVVGAVYGARYSSEQVELLPLEAQLVQVLAAAVGAGLARIASEAEAARRQVQFEQFVSPEVAKELDRDPQMLDGREREITVLFSDIRNFSRLSERLGAGRVCELVGSVMDRLTNRVREFHGTTVSYLGDGLLAMWNAPVEQPDHARLACQAALAMIEDLPELNDQWAEVIGGPLGLGIGVNTGLAVVGNTGSRIKPHYGPLGHTVNLASRVESATKQLGVPVLVTGATRQRLSNDFATRRLCHVRVVGIVEPVEIFELFGETAADEWKKRRDTYESSLTHYESGRWSEACRLINSNLNEMDGELDIPTLTLIERCIDCLKEKPSDFNPVWNLLSK